MDNPNLYVISGGPGVGKTTVLDELARRGVNHAPEVARQIIQEQVASGGTAVPWLDRESYIGLMFERELSSYRRHYPADQPMFSDRGLPDVLAYARLIGLGNTSELELACRSYRYAPLVFLAPPWPEIYATDSERKQDLDEGIRTYEPLRQTYLDCGYRVCVLPKVSPDDRADFILQRLSVELR